MPSCIGCTQNHANRNGWLMMAEIYLHELIEPFFLASPIMFTAPLYRCKFCNRLNHFEPWCGCFVMPMWSDKDYLTYVQKEGDPVVLMILNTKEETKRIPIRITKEDENA